MNNSASPIPNLALSAVAMQTVERSRRWREMLCRQSPKPPVQKTASKTNPSNAPRQ